MAYGFGLENIMQNSFFVILLPWLLTFAIVYGILQHYKIPKSPSARAIISIVFAFFTIPVAGPLMTIIGNMGAALVIAIAGILFLLILFEITGTRHFEGAVTEDGKIIGGKKRITEKYYKAFAFAVVVLAILIFIGAGGLQLLGITIPSINYPVLFFFAVMVIVIIWMVTSEKK